MIEKAIESLNELLKADPDVLVKLANYRIPCNIEFANNPYVQVGAYKKGTTEFAKEDDEVEYKVGLLGILNAVIEPMTGEILMVNCDLEEDNSTFIKMTEFAEYKKK